MPLELQFRHLAGDLLDVSSTPIAPPKQRICLICGILAPPFGLIDPVAPACKNDS